MARDYERKTAHAEAMIQMAMIQLMAARLVGQQLAEPRSDVEKEAARQLAVVTTDVVDGGVSS